MGMKRPDMAISHAVDPGMDTSYRRDESRPERQVVEREKPKRARDVDPFQEDWALKQLIEHEGYRLNPYTDTRGFITGGIGHKFTKEDFDNFDPKWDEDKKSEYWAERFEEDLARSKTAAVAYAIKHDIPQDPKNIYVLTDMAFNLGKKGLSKFERFGKNLGAGDIENAILEMKQRSVDDPTPSKWYTQVPERVDSLAEILRSSHGSG